jgi:hypothetical protein
MSTLSQKKSDHHEVQLALTLKPIKLLYSMGTSVSSSGKAARSEIKHTPLSSAKVKDDWNYTSNPPIRLHSMDKEKVPFKSVFQPTNELNKRLI